MNNTIWGAVIESEMYGTRFLVDGVFVNSGRLFEKNKQAARDAKKSSRMLGMFVEVENRKTGRRVIAYKNGKRFK